MKGSDLLGLVIHRAGRAQPAGRARRVARRLSPRFTFLVLLASLAAAGAPGVAAASPGTLPAPSVAVVCPPAGPGYAACLSLRRTDIPARSRSQVTPLTGPPPGYGPTSLLSAYKLATASLNNGCGETVAIVDAYDQPNAASDLATYRSEFPASTACTPSFQKVTQTGATTGYPAANSGWGLEIDLDIEMVSAICPNCNILLVEASSNAWTDLGAAVDYAATVPGVVAISNSYGGSEGSGETSTDAYYHHAGIAVTASSGDGGYGVEYPAASQYVVGVGGTTLTPASNTRGWTETAWSGAGSGCSKYETKPAWQTDSGCTMRTVADVSAVADPNTGVAVFDDYGYGGWIVVGGTSVASPIIASTYALAGTPTAGSYPASDLYANPAALWDVTSGSNGRCHPSYLCTAGVGYDGPTGLGTPDGTAAFAAPGSSAAPTVTSISPTSGSSAGGTSVTITGTNLTGATAVNFGATAASSFTVDSATSITATSPAGSGTVDVTVTTSGGTSTTTSADQFTYVIAPAPLTITTTSLPAGHLNKPYSATIQATGGVSPYRWTTTSGTLPPGLTLDPSTGTISGDPSSTGSFSFTVTVTDSSATATSKAFSIKIVGR